MKTILIILSAFGLTWLTAAVMVGILGGSVKVEIRNPFTNKFETVTDVKIDRRRI